MKVCFAGMGSMAHRHILNLKKIKNDICIDVLHHSSNYDCKKDITDIIKHHYTKSSELPTDYDVIFITNPTSKHAETLKCLHDNGRHFFIEKPVFLSSKENSGDISFRDDSVYYVAAPLRYTAILQYVKNHIDFSRVYSIRSICSSYLPEWRPDIDYRKCYSANKELGGGVSTDLIHEWDYLTWLLGFPDKVRAITGKKSNLEIDSDDIAIYIAEYVDKTVEVHLDYFGRASMRKLEVFTDDDTITADLIRQVLVWERSGKRIDFSESRDDYQIAELKYFFSIIEGKNINTNDICNACKVLEIAECEQIK